MKSNNHSEKGHTIVEATFVYPIVILVFFALFYAALFLYEKANLQASLENALLYYKSEKTDTGVYILEGLKEDNGGLIGNGFKTPEYENPYRNVMAAGGSAISRFIEKEPKAYSMEKFISSFNGLNGTKIETKYEDNLAFKIIAAEGTKNLSTKLNIGLVGGKNAITIQSKAKITVLDSENLIRDIDFAVDLIMDSKLGDIIRKGVNKIEEGYENLIKTIDKV